MMADWKTLQQEIDEENARIIKEAPEDILRVFQYEVVRSGAGTGGLMLGPWFEGATASRYVGPYYVYNVLKLAMDPGYSLNQIKEMLRLLLPKAVSTAALCGMEMLGRFAQETLACVEKITERDELLALLNSLYLYGSNMNAWIHHYMKWGLGQAFTINSRVELETMASRAGECYR